MLKKRIISLLLFCLILLGFLILLSAHQTKLLHRNPSVLMNKFYKFQKNRPELAEQSIQILLQQDENNIRANEEYGAWQLNNRQLAQALSSFERLHHLQPKDDRYTYQLAYLYYLIGDWENAKTLFNELKNTSPSEEYQNKARAGLKAMSSFISGYRDEVNMIALRQHSQYPSEPVKYQINEIYNQKKTRETRHDVLDVPISSKVLDPVYTLKASAYSAIKEKQYNKAMFFLMRAYQLSHDPSIALQIAYLYEDMHNLTAAYEYFKLATQSREKDIALRAQNAMTNLSGVQTKALPWPYYSEFYFFPFHQSRFDLTVEPLIWRVGIEQNNAIHSKEYTFLRRTQDNRSEDIGLISQIYEDDVQITGVGASINPLPNIPLLAFLEVGAAYDLVYRQREPWRADVRSGVMYFNNFGARPGYYDHIKISTNYYSDWYGEAVYFSRYNNNVIGVVRTHQGIRFLQYQSSMVNLYLTGRVIEDAKRLFYNNIAELGPGISFVPSNRWNFELRYEWLKGYYLPAGAIPNPYSKSYTNQVVQMLFYVRI